LLDKRLRAIVQNLSSFFWRLPSSNLANLANQLSKVANVLAGMKLAHLRLFREISNLSDVATCARNEPAGDAVDSLQEVYCWVVLGNPLRQKHKFVSPCNCFLELLSISYVCSLAIHVQTHFPEIMLSYTSFAPSEPYPTTWYITLT
jgi:hypothetical protein